MWFSHGHPDHLDPESLKQFGDTKFLVPDHAGNRICNGLVEDGFNAEIIKSNEWLQISPNVKIKSFADWNQDASLIIVIGENDVILDLNDGNGLGWSQKIKNEIRHYKNRFLFQLYGWGDSNMINFHDLDGNFISPPAAQKPPVGKKYTAGLKKWGCNLTLPFSSHHRFQRSDTIHLNKYVTPISAHSDGFDQINGNMLPAFISWDSEKEDYSKILPQEPNQLTFDCEDFGDNWHDQLDPEDFVFVETYFKMIEHLKNWLGNIHFVVGSKTHTIHLSNKLPEIIFQVPRNSLIAAIRYEIFDDLLIGNIMKTTLIEFDHLHPEFTPYITKYADNAYAKTTQQLQDYFSYYHKQSRFNFTRDRMLFKSESTIRKFISPDTMLYKIAKPLKKLF